MRGFAQLLLRRLGKSGIVEPQQLQRSLEQIALQSDKLATLIGQLLDIARLEAGRLVLERQTVDLVALVQDVTRTTQNAAQRHTLTVRVPATLSISLDPLRIEQVLVNLL